MTLLGLFIPPGAVDEAAFTFAEADMGKTGRAKFKAAKCRLPSITQVIRALCMMQALLHDCDCLRSMSSLAKGLLADQDGASCNGCYCALLQLP